MTAMGIHGAVSRNGTPQADYAPELTADFESAEAKKPTAKSTMNPADNFACAPSYGHGSSCSQHCRTYYHKAAKETELPSGKNLARVALDDYIGKVYAVERHIKELRGRLERPRF